jgi:hypothetical protein
LNCVVCQSPGTVTRKALNGLPLGVVACEDCRQAVLARKVGVVVRENGDLHITDARHLDFTPEPMTAPTQESQLELFL